MDEKRLTLSELLGGVREAITGAYPFGVWVVAEIGELKENAYSGHCYMELVEKGKNEGAPKAKAQATVWRNRWTAVDACFRAATGERLAVGMEVLLKVTVAFHEVYGFSLSVADIDPSFTLGGAEQRRRQTIEQLKKEGTIDLNASLEPPVVIQRIAVVSSATAAGLGDFMRHLESSPYRFETELFEALMQGSEAEGSIIAALEQIALRGEEFDAVVVIRGGGSRSDLGCFDGYPLCSNMAQFPLPILTGIGHDKDVSVADIVAWRALKTPTAVADFITSRADEFANTVDDLYGRIVDIAERAVESNSARIERLGAGVSAAAAQALHMAALSVERRTGELSLATQRLTLGCSQRLDRVHSLLLMGAESVVATHTARLDAAAATVAGNNPERILSLGFAIVRMDGKAQTDAAALLRGDELDIELAKGRIKAKIS